MTMAEMDALLPGPGQREIVFGGTRSGKSSYEEWVTRRIAATRPSAMQIIVDTKPRFRAETEQMPVRPAKRRSAAWRYKSWASGPVVPGSVLVDLKRDHPFRGIWSQPGEIAILQSGEAADWQRMLVLLTGFVKANIKDRERRIVVDEALDFYQRNTFSINNRNDVFYRASRAGGERNIGLSMGAHRVHGLPPLIMSMANVFVLFHLRQDSDMRYLAEFGITDETSPEGNYVFRRFEIQPGGTVSPPFTGICDYPDSYLRQLAAA